MPTICCYAIFKDEAHNVADWAKTTADADQRFVLDTGSTDGTLNELAMQGLKFYIATFDPFRFDDARNTSLALAPQADLYWKLDADERLPTDWRHQIEAVYQPDIPRYTYRVENHGGGTWGRIVRNDIHRRPGFRWKYPVHECVVGPSVSIDIPGLVVENHPSTTRADYTGRYLELLSLAVAEMPADHRMAFYYARELWYRNQWADCRTAMTRFLGMPGGWNNERCEAYRILAAIDTYPDRWLWHAVGEAPDRREPWVDLARFYLRAGDVRKARGILPFAVAADNDALYTTQADCWGDEFDRLVEALS